MKKKSSLLIIMLTAALICEAQPCFKDIYGQPKAMKIDNIDLPLINSLTMKNSIRLFYIKDELPRLTIIMSAGFGKLYENNTNAGISDLLAKTLSLAGSKKYPAEMLHNTIENIGGKFSVYSSWEDTSVAIEVLEKYSGLAFDILLDMAMNPNLDSKIIENARSLLLEDVRRKKDNPDALAFEKAREIIFSGAGYGSFPTEKSLKSISKSDLANVLADYFTGKNIIIGISSSLSYDEIGKNANGFAAIKEGGRMDYSIDSNAVSASMAEKSKKIYLLPKDIPQATIVVGVIAPDIKDKRAYPLTVMNDILGGSDFNSRLMHEIRVKRGLAYAVQSVIKFRKNTGVFLAYAQTRNETADVALSLMLENIEQMSKSQVKNEELKLAKDSIKNSYIFEFDTPVNILKKYSFLSYNELPEAFLLEYVKRMENVSKDEIQKEASQLFGNGLIKVVIGKKELEKKLDKFGSVVIMNE